MSSKITVTTLVLSAIGLIFTASADARGRGCCNCNSGGSGTYYTAQASDGRVYSYEPGSGYYVSPRASTRSNVPLYLLPKSDSRKYEVR